MCNPRPMRSFLNSLCRPVIAMTIIIHKDLNYAVKGVLFDGHNALGPGGRGFIAGGGCYDEGKAS